MQTNDIFTAITDGKTVSIPMDSRTEFDSLRTGLIRRYSRWAKQFSDMGDDTYSNQYVSSTFVDNMAVFCLKSKDEMKRKPRSYVVNIL